MKKFLLAFLALALSTTTFAADSETNRVNSTLGFGIVPVAGSTAYILNFPTASVGWYLNESWYIGIEQASGSYTESVQTSYIDTMGFETPMTTNNTGSSAQTGIMVRWFAGNSWNFYLGFHERNLQFNSISSGTHPFLMSTIETTGSITVKNQVVTVGTGNEWIMDSGIVLGVDWIALSAPASQQKNVQMGNNVGVDNPASALAQLQQGADGADLATYAPGLLVIRVGYAF